MRGKRIMVDCATVQSYNVSEHEFCQCDYTVYSYTETKEAYQEDICGQDAAAVLLSPRIVYTQREKAQFV